MAHFPFVELRVVIHIDITLVNTSNVVPVVPAEGLKRTKPLFHEITLRSSIRAEAKRGLTAIESIRRAADSFSHGAVCWTVHIGIHAVRDATAQTTI